MPEMRRTPWPYRFLDQGSGVLLCAMTVAAPWMFGCTQDWSRAVMHAAAAVLAAALFGKVLIRGAFGIQPGQWTVWPGARRASVLLLAALTALLLAYVAASLWNGGYRFSYNTRIGPELIPLERPVVRWLPSSFDVVETRSALADEAALAAVFWAARHWLNGKSGRERRRDEDAPQRLPSRLRTWLWVLCVNGAVLGLVSTLQRLDHADKLLWLVDSYYPGERGTSFGPFSYRTNAAQYFNLILPMALGLWWTLRRESRSLDGPGRRSGSSPHVVLLPCAILIGACPIISTSRGGTLILGGLILVAGIVLVSAPHGGRAAGLAMGGVAAGAIALGVFLGGKPLSARFETVIADRMSGRPQIYAVARRMAADYPWWGSGPGTFKSLFGFYRPDEKAEWAGYAHNDWLETRITFGRIGLALVVSALVAVAAAAWLGTGMGAPRVLPAMGALSAGGMLFHALFDFPFQIFSLSMTFTAILAAVSVLGWRGVRRD